LREYCNGNVPVREERERERERERKTNVRMRDGKKSIHPQNEKE
jgi:hypothetical protein